ncbi:MAG: hypothetical protein ACJAS9_003569 [Polaribacter sp.]|jgi:hypothetical protein
MPDTIKINQLKIPNYSGSLTEILDGDFTEKDLINQLVEYWVPYVNCHKKCLASDICPFAQKPRDEERCGFKAKTIATFIEWTFDDLKNENTTNIQNMLIAGFHLTEFLYVGQFYNGMMVNDASKAWSKSLGKSMMFQILSLRDHLNTAASHVSEVVDDFSKTSITFVEGETEKLLLTILRKEISLLNDDMQIESYEGGGNANPKRSAMLVQSKLDEGYVVRVQGDRDGHERASIDKLQSSLNLQATRVFAFKYDLESAYPTRLLAKVLVELGILDSEQLDRYSYDYSVSVSRYILSEFKIDISPFKIRIAELIGKKLINSGLAYFKPDHRFFSENELGRFILFCSWWSNG